MAENSLYEEITSLSPDVLLGCIAVLRTYYVDAAYYAITDGVAL